MELAIEQVEQRILSRGLHGLQYYNGETHHAVLAHPNFVRELLRQDAVPLSAGNLVEEEVIPTEDRGNLVLEYR